MIVTPVRKFAFHGELLLSAHLAARIANVLQHLRHIAVQIRKLTRNVLLAVRLPLGDILICLRSERFSFLLRLLTDGIRLHKAIGILLRLVDDISRFVICFVDNRTGIRICLRRCAGANPFGFLLGGFGILLRIGACLFALGTRGGACAFRRCASSAAVCRCISASCCARDRVASFSFSTACA